MMQAAGPSSGRAADPDAADVALAKDGDLAAFERLYHRHSPRVNTLAAWMLGRSDTEDVLQDVFIRTSFPRFARSRRSQRGFINSRST